MAKKRIYELAKDNKVSSKAMVEIIRNLGFDVKSHSSSIDDNIIRAVNKKFDSEKEEVKKEIEEKKRKAQAREKQKELEAEKTKKTEPVKRIRRDKNRLPRQRRNFTINRFRGKDAINGKRKKRE